MRIFYLQIRSFYEVPAWEHFLGSLFNHLITAGNMMRIVCYKQRGKPKCGATLSDSDMVSTLTLNRLYPSGFFMRYLYECWLVVRTMFHHKLWRGSDVCLVASFPSSFLNIWISKVVFRKKVVYWVTDLWPDNAVKVGAMKSDGLLYKFFVWLERKAYRRADFVITVSEDINPALEKYGASLKNIGTVHIWSKNDELADIPCDENKFVKFANLQKDKFYAVYAGSVGAPQNLELVVGAAKLLVERTDIEFIIVGGGIYLNKIKDMAKGLENIMFYPLQPTEDAPHIYSAASVNLVTLKKGIIKTALPSKTANILQVGGKILACVDTDSYYASLIRDYSVGEVVDPDDALGLAESIRKMADDPQNNGQKQRAHRCFQEQFSQKVTFGKFVDVFQKTQRESDRV